MKVLKSTDGEDRFGKLLDIAWEYRKSHPDSTIYYADLALDLVDEYGITKGAARPLNFKGVAYHYKGDNLKSFDYYNMAIDKALSNNDSVQYAHAMNSLGRTFLVQGDLLKAYDHYNTAVEVFKRYDDQQGLGYGYKSLSELYQTQSNFKKALEMSEKTLQIRLASGNIRGQISILMEIAYIYQMMGNFEKSFDFYLQAKIKAESINDQINIATINLGIADLYYSDGKYQEALIFAKKADDIASTTENINLINNILLQLGEIYYEQGDLKLSSSYLQQAINASQLSKEMVVLRDAHFLLSEIFKAQQNLTQAYSHYVKYSEIRQMLNNTDVTRTIEKLEARLEIEKREQQNDLLLANQARDQAIIERQRIQNIALIVVSIVIFILGVNLYITSRKRRQANLRLHEKNERIALQGEEINAQYEQITKQNEKLTRRNEELADINNEKDTLTSIVAHDLKSPFSRIKGLVELLKLTNLNGEQSNYVNLLDDISKSGADLIRDLLDVNAFEAEKRRSEISKIDVHDMLLKKMKSFYADGRSKGIEIKAPSADHHVFLVSDEVYLSRILDNLISNAIKFSPKDAEVVLSAGYKSDYLYISVKDQGLGFSEEDKKHLYTKFKKLSARPTAGESSNGLGLAIVKTLVDRMDGEIELKTQEGKGSEFIVKFPSRAEVAAI